MDRRRAAAALLALAACFVCSTAAPTATNPTAIDLVDGRTEGCYYNFQHYGEGDRIMTNEPCLNCTCHNRMLMCYLRVCPFTKAIGQDCTVEKRADQCCPIVTCPDVPVDLLTSTSTSSPAEYGATGLGKLDKYGCSINGKYFSEGSKVPPTPNKPCEHCYCIRNMTTCVMQECTLHVDGCTPIYHKDVCCPVRYSCDHPEDEIPLLDDMTTTVRPTPGFLLTTTTMVPVTQASQDCVHEDQVFPDGAHIKTEKACEHCYCMKGDIVCVVQGCGTPMENEGKNCTALPLRPGQCCPDTYICESDEHNVDLTTEITDISTMPPRRVGIEGSGYRNEPDEPFKDIGTLGADEEGSGEEYIATTPINIEGTSVDEKPTYGDDKILATTTHQDMPTSQATEEKEENYSPDVLPDRTSSAIPEQNILSYTTEAITEFALTSKDIDKTTISDKDQSVNEFVTKKEEIFTTESISRKEDNNVEPDAVLHEEENKITTASSDNLLEESPYKEPENDGNEFIMESFDKKATTESTKYIAENIDTTKNRDDMYDSQTESTYTDKITENKILSEVTTDREVPTTSSYITQENINLSEIQTTTIDSAYNEIDENSEDNIKPARIPGEGDCLLDGITYGNNTNVPRSNNCHTSCKCMSSIIKCDPIICSPPPEYIENMNDCQPIYDSPDSCCPTYVCSAKETIPPQSHSQMSGTESPKLIETVECDDSNNCGLENVEKRPSVPENPCLSDDCIEKSEKPEKSPCETKECGESAATVPPKLQDCSDGKCQVLPVVACEGENCNNDSSEKPISIDNNAEKDSSNCSDKEGCPVAVDNLQKECASETCRRKDEPKLENKLPSDCSGMECKTNNEVALTPKSDEEHSTDVATEESIYDMETATNEAIVKDENNPPSQDAIKKTEIIDIPVSVTETEEVTDQLINVVNELGYTRLPTPQTMSDRTETEDVKSIAEQHTIGTLEESQKTDMDEVTEKMNIGQIYEKDKVTTENEPIYTESLQPIHLTADEITDKIQLVTTESINDNKGSDIDSTNAEDIYTVSPTLGHQEVTKMPEMTQPEKSTPIQSLQSTTLDHMQTDNSETNLSEEKEEELSKSTTISSEEINKIKDLSDSVASTTDLPKSESIDESHYEAPVTDIGKDTYEVLHTTQVFEETNTNRNTPEHVNTIMNLETTESAGLQNEITTQTNFENPHEPIISGINETLDTEQHAVTDKPEIMTDKLDDLQFITDQPEVTSTKDIAQVSVVDDISEYDTISNAASQSSYSPKDEITTKAYYDTTEENTQYNELLGHSTPQNPESIRPDVEEKNKDVEPSYGIDNTMPTKTEEGSQVTESIDSHAVHPMTGEESTKIPDISIEKDITSMAPEITLIDDSDMSEQQGPNVQLAGDTNESVTDIPKDSSISTESIINSLGSTQDKTYEIETKDSEKELNAPSTETIDLWTIKDNKEYTNDIEVLATESAPKYTLNYGQDLQTSTNKNILEEEEDKQSNIQGQITTLQDNLVIQESTTEPQDEDNRIEIQTIIPDISYNKPKDQLSKVPENKLTTAQFDITQEILKEDELLSKKEPSTSKYSTESPDINTDVIKDKEIHIDTTTKGIIDDEEHKPTEVQDLFEKSTWRPHVDQKDIVDEIESSTSLDNLDKINIEKEIESSTSFINLETSEGVEKSTVSINMVTEKLDNQDQIDTNKLQTLTDEKVSKITTEKSLTEQLYPLHSTFEPTRIEVNTEQISVQAPVEPKDKEIEKSQEESSGTPEITETDTITTTDIILTTQDKEPKLPEHSLNSDHSLLPEVTDKSDEKNKLPEYEQSTEFVISPTILTSGKDIVVTEIPHALVTDIIHTESFNEIETKIETTTKIDEQRVPYSDVAFTTQSQEQLFETPEVDHPKISDIQKETSQDGSLTSANTETVSSEHTFATTLSPLQEVDVEEQNKETQSIEQQSDKSENVVPTDVVPITQQSESFTENIFASTSSEKEDETLYEEEKKPVTESIPKKTPELPSEHHIPVFIQDNDPTLLEVSTDSTDIIDNEKDQESKVTEFTPVKPQKPYTYDTIATDAVTEIYEKEKSSDKIETRITTEISKIPEEIIPISTMAPEKSTNIADLKESEISEREHISTEIYVSEEKVETSTISAFEVIPEEKETLKPHSDGKITDETYDSVTENKASASLDVSTELPDKMVTDVNEVSTPFVQKEVTTSVDFNKDYSENDITKVPELISSDIEKETQLSSKIPHSIDVTSPVPFTDDIQSEKDITLTSSKLSIPTESILTEKQEHEATTKGVEVDISNMDTNIPISTEKHENDDEVTHHEYSYSETTPFSVELEEHTHSLDQVSSTGLPISEISTDNNYKPHEPERGDVLETEEPIKSTERSPLDFEHKEKPATSIKDISGENVESTIIPINLDNDIELSTDRQMAVPTEEPIHHIPTIQTEELILSTSQQTTNEQVSNTSEQPLLIPTSSVISTEKDVIISSESPIKHEQPQSIVDSEITEQIPQHVTSSKFDENMQTDSPIHDEKLSSVSPSSPIPELSKPIFNEEPVEDVPSPDFPPSGTGGYGQEPDYVEEDQAFGPGTCRYGGKVYVSAQQIPRDDPCDFCFCFRSDIICLQQSCPPPIHGCHEEPIQGFCCPRYECPVSMATTLNMTTTTTTTTTTLPPHFLPHAYKGAAQRRGCQIKGHTYKVGEVVRASSGPCLHCTCGGDGQMKCDPKACTPEPMLRQMIAAAVSAKRRR